MTEEEHAVVAEMERYGGSFVQHLAALYRRGDCTNRAIIRQAFSEYWCEYRGLAEKTRAASHSIESAVPN